MLTKKQRKTSGVRAKEKGKTRDQVKRIAWKLRVPYKTVSETKTRAR